MAVIKKDYLTFGELRDRWGITDEDMHYLIGKGELVASMTWHGEVKVLRKGDQKEREPAYEFIFDNKPYLVGGWFYLCIPSENVRSVADYGGTIFQKAHPLDDPFPCEQFALEKDGKHYFAQAAEIKERGVFFKRAIELCEEKHPELRKLSEADDQSQTAQNDQGLDKELSGKSVGTVAKIIGGLLMTGHGADIHADGKFDFIGEVLRDLGFVGASVSENTLREWINRAKEVIEPPKKT